MQTTSHPAIEKLQNPVVLVTTIRIARSREDVFNFVTTPAHWHRWHPATRSVREVPPRPLVVGETIHESIRAAWREFDAIWTVLECAPHERWVIATDTAYGASRITYRVTAHGGSCEFQRTLEYRSRNWPWTALDGSLTRRKFERQSNTALTNLKATLEAEKA
jgi:uncharacterized protein YndB with AHSA1/START domain